MSLEIRVFLMGALLMGVEFQQGMRVAT